MNEIWYAILFYFAYSLFGILGFAVTIRFSKKVNLFSLTIAKPLGMVLFAYPIWLFASLKILPFNNQVLLLAIFIIALIGSFISIQRFLNKSHNQETKLYLKSRDFLKKLIIFEIISLVLFFTYLYFRSFRPEIGLSEKYMDYFLYISSGRTDYFPFFDGWYAAKPINYYYYGFYLFALLTRISGVPYAFGYNLSLGIILIASAPIIFSLVKLIARYRFFALLGVIFVLGAGNLHFANCYLTHFGSSNMHTECTMHSATRIYGDSQTINEFPAYNLIQGDLHPHVMSIPFFLLNLYLIYLIYSSKKLNPYLMVSFIITMGTSLVVNSWDFITLGILFGILSIVRIIKYFSRTRSDLSIKKRLLVLILKFRKLLLWILAVALVPFILFLPFFLHFQSPVTGIGFIPEFVKFYNGDWNTFQWPSKPSYHMGIWGIFGIVLLVGYLLWILQKKDRKRLLFPLILGSISVGLVIFTELFFFEDLFQTLNPPFFRGNTVFKFGYHAWILFGICTAIILAYFWRKISTSSFSTFERYAKVAFGVLIITMLAVSTLFTFEASRQYFKPRFPWAIGDKKLTLNASKYLIDEEGIPFDVATIDWLLENEPKRVVILEAPGGSYYLNSRLAVFSGNGNVFNWRPHQKTWRFKFPEGIKNWKNTNGERIDIVSPEFIAIENDIVRIYESDDVEEARALLTKHNVDYIYVGGIEQNYESLNEEKFLQLGSVVFNTKFTRLYKINNK